MYHAARELKELGDLRNRRLKRIVGATEREPDPDWRHTAVKIGFGILLVGALLIRLTR